MRSSPHCGYASMVKRLRRRPLTAESGVRFPMEVPRIKAVLRGGFILPQKVSSLGEASLRYFLGTPNIPQKVSSLGEVSLRYFLGTPGELRISVCEFALVSGAKRPAVLFGGPEFTPKSVLGSRCSPPVHFGDPELLRISVVRVRSTL